MIVKACLVEKKEVELSYDQMKEITLEYLKYRYDIEPNMTIKNSKIIKKVTYTGSHKWIDTEVYRNQRNFDKEVLKIITNLEEEK